MTLTTEAFLWAAAILMAAFAGAVRWIDAETVSLLIGALPALAMLHLGTAALREPICTSKEI